MVPENIIYKGSFSANLGEKGCVEKITRVGSELLVRVGLLLRIGISGRGKGWRKWESSLYSMAVITKHTFLFLLFSFSVYAVSEAAVVLGMRFTRNLYVQGAARKVEYVKVILA